jgi:hypothetical protein
MTWTEALESYLRTLTPSTANQYRIALGDFATWYRFTYGEEPEPVLLTDEEAREWRSHLSGVRNLKAATCVGYLSHPCGFQVRISAKSGIMCDLQSTIH